MRVLLVHKLLELTGGAEVFYREVGRVLQENGHEVHYFATGDAAKIDWSDTLRREDATLIDAPDYDDPSMLAKARAFPRAVWSKPAQAKMAEVIARFRPDIVHCFAIHVHLSPSILEAARVAGVPVVMTCNDYKHICPNYKLYHHDRVCFDCRTQNFGNAIRNRCAKGSLALSVASAIEARVHYGKGVYDRLVDHYTFSADFMAGVTEDFWQGRDISWSKLRNPFDSNAHTSEDGDDGHALYFGRLIDEKGVQILVEAAAKVGDMPVKIVGDGPEAAALQTQAASLGLTNVEFLGPLWNNDLMPVLRRARCVVVPSLWHENYPYVINQAFAVGRPVIGSRRGGITELVADGERGLVYDAADPDALARALRTLRDDPDLARRMGRAAKAWSDATFRDDVFYADLRSAYEEAFDAHSGSRR